MKILRIVSSGYEQGGIETHVALLQHIQEKRGHIVKIFSSDARPDATHFNHYSYKTPSGWNKFIYGTWNPYAYRELKKALQEFQPDIVDIHSIGNASPAILFPLKHYPTILTIHSAEGFTKSLLIWCFPPSYFKNGEYDVKNLNFMGKVRYAYHRTIGDAMYRVGLRNVDRFVTLSHYMNRIMEGEGLKNTYVPMGITLFEHAPMEERNISHTIAFAGRLETSKGVDDLIVAMRPVVDRFPDARLMIAGEGSEKLPLQKMVKEMGLADHIAFLGYLDRKQLEDIYRRSSVVVMPSVAPEAFGKVGIEAMSVGRPVVATKVGGISDWLIDGENGILVSPKDPVAIAAAINILFEDPHRLVAMGNRARAKAEEFTLEKHVEEMEKIYEGTRIVIK